MSTTQTDFLRYLRTLTARQATEMLSDQQLLERFLHERSEASFAALVARHGPMVLSVCRRVLQHAQDAEDAFQATFLVLARKASTIRKQASLGSWLHGVAYHSAECLRAKARRRAVHERRLNAPPPGDAMDDISWRELRLVLDEELQRLPEKYRAPLVLCYLEGRTQDEAARQLGWSKNTFRRRLESGRATLDRRLTRRGVTLSAALTASMLADAMAQAALPPLLAASTVRAGIAAATGNTVSGIVSAQVAALVERGAASLLAKKAGVAIVLLVSLTLSVGGLLAHRLVQDRIIAEAPAALPQGGSERDVEPRPRRSQAVRENEEMSTNSLEVHGVVRRPDDKPIKGAKIYCGYIQKKMKQQIVTDAEGHYRFTLRRDDVDSKGYTADPWEWTPLIAVVDGYGLGWRHLGERDKNNRLDLRLVADDAPIEGRILDLEGRPVVGATVRIIRLHATADEDLSSFLKQWTIDLHQAITGATGFRAGGGPIRKNSPISWRRLWWVYQTGLFPPMTTDKDGRFHMAGLGRERLVELLISGPGIEQAELQAVTRKNVDVKALNKLAADYLTNPDVQLPFPWPILRGAVFTHVAMPTKPIVGVVRDKVNGKPVAGIRIHGKSRLSKNGAIWPGDIETVTDEQGAYRLAGLPKDREYSILVGAPEGVNYLPLAKSLMDTAGLEPLKADFELERGVVVEGRLLDKSSGKPLAGEVYYAPLPRNSRIADQERGALHQFIVNKHSVGKDGVFKFVAYPGPGVVSAVAAKGSYRPTPFTVEEQKLGLGDRYLPVAGVPVEIQKQAHRLIDSEAKAEPLKCDLFFQPAGPEKGATEKP
jgi:RNA polymerase sigma factor (sigma-70 family)